MAITRYDDIFAWDGWGGKFKLTSGRCHLRIYDLQKSGKEDPVFFKPIIAVVSDLPETYGARGVMTVRSCAGHIATQLIRQFKIKPERMLYVEYHPQKFYGRPPVRSIPERYEAVDFRWHQEKAFATNWRNLDTPLKKKIKQLLRGT